MLKAEIQAEILSLHYGKQKSARWIANELKISRKSVATVLLRRSVALIPKRGRRESILDPYKDQILELLKQEPQLYSTSLLQQLRQQGYMGSLSTLTQWVFKNRQIRSKNREAFFKLEFSPGECAQVDWGEFGDVFGDGIKVHCFVMVLAYSRLIYIEFTRSEKFEEWIRCHENAFRFFGGVPLECWYDNLATAVTDRMGSLIRFNSRFMAYLGHHAVKPHACNPARGNEKGRVEDGVKYIRSSFWAGRKFTEFQMLCQQAILWRDGIANRREHRSTRKIPVLQFQSEEKNALRPLNPNSFDTHELISKVVPPQFHIVYETNFYSVPWTLVGMTVTVKVNHQEIFFFYQDRLVSAHQRCYKKHQNFTHPKHLQGLKERKPGESRENWQMQAIRSMGPRMQDYVSFLRSGHRSIRTEVSRILALSTVYGESLVYSACESLLHSGIIGVDELERTLKSQCDLEQQQALLPQPLNFQNSKLNRVVSSVDLRRYDALLFESALSSNASIQKSGESKHEHNPIDRTKSI